MSLLLDKDLWLSIKQEVPFILSEVRPSHRFDQPCRQRQFQALIQHIVQVRYGHNLVQEAKLILQGVCRRASLEVWLEISDLMCNLSDLARQFEVIADG